MSKFDRGNVRGSHKLTAEQVLEMRTRYAAGWTQGALARHYGVSGNHVGRIVRGESWTQYGGPPQPRGRWEPPDELALASHLPPITPELEAAAQASAERLRALLAGGTEAPRDALAEAQAVLAAEGPMARLQAQIAAAREAKARSEEISVVAGPTGSAALAVYESAVVATTGDEGQPQ